MTMITKVRKCNLVFIYWTLRALEKNRQRQKEEGGNFGAVYRRSNHENSTQVYTLSKQDDDQQSANIQPGGQSLDIVSPRKERQPQEV